MFLRFNLSFRGIEELMVERGIDVSYETIGHGGEELPV